MLVDALKIRWISPGLCKGGYTDLNEFTHSTGKAAVAVARLGVSVGFGCIPLLTNQPTKGVKGHDSPSLLRFLCFLACRASDELSPLRERGAGAMKRLIRCGNNGGPEWYNQTVQEATSSKGHRCERSKKLLVAPVPSPHKIGVHDNSTV